MSKRVCAYLAGEKVNPQSLSTGLATTLDPKMGLNCYYRVTRKWKAVCNAFPYSDRGQV